MHGLRGNRPHAIAARQRGDVVLLLLHRQGLVELARRAVGHDVDAVGIDLGRDPELGQVALQLGDVGLALPVRLSELANGEIAS